MLDHAINYATAWDKYIFPAPADGEQLKKGIYAAQYGNGRRWGNTKDPDLIRTYFSEHPNANIGLLTGEENGIFVTEYDTPQGHGIDGKAEMEKLEAEHGKLPETLRQRSPSGSIHFFWQHPGFDVKSSNSKIAPGIDVKGDRSMVLIAPSVRPGRGEYEWLNAGTPIAAAPQWLLDLIKTAATESASIASNQPPVVIPPSLPGVTPVEKALHDEYHRVALAGKNKRNATLNTSALKLGKLVGAGELNEEKAIQILINACGANGLFAEEAGQCHATIKSGMTAGKADPVETVHTMFGAAVAALNAPPLASDQGPTLPLAPEGTPMPQVREPEDEKLTQVTKEDFLAHLEMHQFIHVKTGKLWPAATINNTLPAVEVGTKEVVNSKGETETKPVFEPASKWLNKNAGIACLTWAPGRDSLIEGEVVNQGGWIDAPGQWTYNQYFPPKIVRKQGDVSKWTGLVRRVYPTDADHVVKFCAHRVQHPEQKINHALFLGGHMGIGKDSILVPVVQAVGPWNCNEISPERLLGQFNGFVKCVVLRISEARDLGDQTRNEFYERIKTLLVVPPPTLEVNEKHLRSHWVPNICGTIITSNHQDALFLPADDRRFYIAWSPLKKEDFEPGYWTDLHKWFENGGNEAVAHYLATLDLSDFDAKAPPPKTAAWKRMATMSRAPEDAELADVIEKLGNPDAVTIEQVKSRGDIALLEFFRDKRNSRNIWKRFEDCGYVAVDNPDAKSGLWQIGGTRQVVYANQTLTDHERLAAARHLMRAPPATPPRSNGPPMPPPPY